MRKKLGLIAATVALGAFLVVGGTLAWFTDTDTATNVVTMGNVDIAIVEDIKVDDGAKHWTAVGDIENPSKDITYTNVTPGTIVDKVVTIPNMGNNDAYVRLKVEALSENTALDLTGIKYYTVDKDALQAFTNPGGKPVAISEDMWKQFIADKGTEVVLDSEGYVYYTENDGVLKSKTAWQYAFVAVEFPGAEWDNAYANAGISIQLTAEAIQSNNIDVVGEVSAESLKALFDTNFTAE